MKMIYTPVLFLFCSLTLPAQSWYESANSAPLEEKPCFGDPQNLVM